MLYKCFPFLFASFLVFFPHAIFAEVSSEKRVDEFNLESNLALKGYDPVSYFENGPEKGNEGISSVYKGVKYYFASEESKSRFDQSPGVYEPAYGGWCAWAMLTGDKADVDPLSYKIVEGKLLLFYNGFFGNTLKKWEKKASTSNEVEMVNRAGTEWQDLIG